MLKSKMTVVSDFKIAKVDKRLFGSFIEHLGKCVYGGIYEPEHPTANEFGFREDVIKLVKDLGVTYIRYPGGNFVSQYNWEDGVGPVEKRPAKFDAAWRKIEPNTIGLNEFAKWAELTGCEVNMTVNLGTRGPEDARNLVEYCNYDSGTYYSDMRRSHGISKPYKFKTWCLGNEMDHYSQIGHKNGSDYGKIAREAAKIMKRVDPSIELAACGSTGTGGPDYITWDIDMLDAGYDEFDYISLHNYYLKRENGKELDLPSFFARSLEMDDYIKSVTAACDAVKAKKHSNKTMYISFDEWNMYFSNTYYLKDVVLFGGLLITLLRNCDRVKIACLALLVNSMAPIKTVPGGVAYKQPIFFPFEHASHYGRGTVLRSANESPVYNTEKHSEVPFIDSIAVVNDETEEIAIFAINRHLEETFEFEFKMFGFGSYEPIEHIVLDGDPDSTNTPENPELVKPHTVNDIKTEHGSVYTNLNPCSWNMIRLKRI